MTSEIQVPKTVSQNPLRYCCKYRVLPTPIGSESSERGSRNVYIVQTPWVTFFKSEIIVIVYFSHKCMLTVEILENTRNYRGENKIIHDSIA